MKDHPLTTEAHRILASEEGESVFIDGGTLTNRESEILDWFEKHCHALLTAFDDLDWKADELELENAALRADLKMVIGIHSELVLLRLEAFPESASVVVKEIAAKYGIATDIP